MKDFVEVGINGQGVDAIIPRKEITPTRYAWHGDPLPENWAETVTWIQLYVSENEERMVGYIC